MNKLNLNLSSSKLSPAEHLWFDRVEQIYNHPDSGFKLTSSSLDLIDRLHSEGVQKLTKKQTNWILDIMDVLGI